ncbi:MAG: L-ribulokinase [Gaiellaceae bacterium]|nr:L-ribulokinase [Gaiellaceae bacterium]
MTERRCVVGLDFGTSSARALLVDAATGEELTSSVYTYRGGSDGVVGDPHDPTLARQEPSDYVDALVSTLAETARAAVESGEQIRIEGIGVDTTGSTPLPLDESGQPLAFDPRFEGDPAAKAWLWKDHTAHAEAGELTALARELGTPYLDYCGGTYSSEWFWSKILRCSRVAPDVFSAAHTWAEISDYIPSVATGGGRALTRNACAAGHKALFSTLWGGLPSEEFLAALAPELAALRGRLYSSVLPASEAAGTLDPALAKHTGLDSSITIAVGTMDAHAGAVAAGVRPGRLVKIIGTSTCDCTVAPELVPLPGVCGVVSDSIIPGLTGIEAGQSAVGDLFEWYLRHVGLGAGGHERLQAEAAQLRPGESGLVALDWNNGNRTILVDPLLSGLLIGQSLHTTPAEVYRALIEATAFGARIIIDQIERFGPAIDDVVVTGGIATKSPLAMQVYADVLNRPIHRARSEQACAVGAAIYAAVASGIHATTEQAQAAMGGVGGGEYRPDPAAARVYERLYAIYGRLHDAFGGVAQSDMGSVMKELIEIRTAASG